MWHLREIIDKRIVYFKNTIRKQLSKMFSILSFGSSLAQCLPEILSEEKCVNVAKVYQQRALRKDDSGSKMLIEPI